jgi:hypothetical protein
MVFLIFIAKVWIESPHKSTTRRGRICVVIQVHLLFVIGIGGAFIGKWIFGSSFVALLFGLLLAGLNFYCIEKIIEKLGINSNERTIL